MHRHGLPFRPSLARARVAACLGAALLAGLAPRARAQDAAEAATPATPPATTPSAKPFAALNAPARSLRDSIVAMARAQVGRRYVHGGTSPDRGFDCSGLVRYVMGALRLDLPRTARQQATAGVALGRDTARLRPGDLLTFGRTRKGTGVSHVGIYVGHGRFVHASSAAGRVIESPLDRPASPLVRRFRGARRIAASDEGEVALLPHRRSE